MSAILYEKLYISFCQKTTRWSRPEVHSDRQEVMSLTIRETTDYAIISFEICELNNHSLILSYRYY